MKQNIIKIVYTFHYYITSNKLFCNNQLRYINYEQIAANIAADFT